MSISQKVRALLGLCLLLPATSVTAAQLCENVFETRAGLSAEQNLFVSKDLAGTIQSLNQMRAQNGLLADTIMVASNGHVSVINKDTSPTNIAMDLLVLATRRERGDAIAAATLSRVLQTLEKLPYHRATGLLFTRYTADESIAVKDANVSSIDNMHLAIALKTLKTSMRGTADGLRAARLFDRMDFSVYYDEAAGLMGGNLSYRDGHWTLDEYRFANLGSEARTIYSAGWAMGLFKNIKDDRAYLNKVFAKIDVEVVHSSSGELLKLWDGSAFQLYFPKMFINEELYSPVLSQIYLNHANFMIAEGQRRGLNTPAAHSAGLGTMAEFGGAPNAIAYKDKSGNIPLVSSDNQDVHIQDLRKNWETTFAPNAFYMAATSAPAKFMGIFDRLRQVTSGHDAFFRPDLGWMDGLQVQGSAKGVVIPGQLSLNQGAIAMSILQMQSQDGLSLSSRVLRDDPAISARLKIFYQAFDRKLKGLPR